MQTGWRTQSVSPYIYPPLLLAPLLTRRKDHVSYRTLHREHLCDSIGNRKIAKRELNTISMTSAISNFLFLLNWKLCMYMIPFNIFCWYIRCIPIQSAPNPATTQLKTSYLHNPITPTISPADRNSWVISKLLRSRRPLKLFVSSYRLSLLGRTYLVLTLVLFLFAFPYMYCSCRYCF